MKEVVLKTALKTLLAVAIAAVLAFGILSFGFPQTMAGISEKLGNYSVAATYASLRYTYTGDINDLSRCAEDSVLAKNDGKIIKFCGELVEKEDFSALCKQKDESSDIKNFSYKQFIFGNLSAAKYRSGDKDGAVEAAETAMQGVEGFPVNNAYGVLTIEVAKNKDKETADKLLEKLKAFEGVEADYLKIVLQALENTGE